MSQYAFALAHSMVEGFSKKRQKMKKNEKISKVTKFTSEASSRQLVLHTRLPVSKNDS